MKRLSISWESLLTVAIVLIASICAQSQQFAVAQNAEEGRVVEISPDGDAVELQIEERLVEVPAYWIGIRGRSIESAVLRTHLQLAEGMGVVVEEVVEGSPAAKAGLRNHDIILRVNGDEVDSMQVLQKQVFAGKDKALELNIIRLSKEEKLVVIPEERPESIVEQPTVRRRRLGNLGEGVVEGDVLQQLMQQFGGRNIGPGMVFRGGGQMFNLNQMPNGVSVSIQRHDDGPAKITVKKGEQTWQIEGDDEEALKKLPEDVRPFVQRMLRGNGHGLGAAFELGDLDVQIQEALPRDLNKFLPRGKELLREFEAEENDLREKLEKQEQQIKELQKMFERLRAEIPAGETS